MERVERENARAEARRPVRKVHLYADRAPANVAPAIQQVMGPTEKRWLFETAPAEWRIVHRKPKTAFTEYEKASAYVAEHFGDSGETELQRIRRQQREQAPIAFSGEIPYHVQPDYGGVTKHVARELHAQRQANIEEEFGSRLRNPPKSPQTPKEKSQKRIRKKRRDPLYTSVHYPGDTPRK